MLYFGPGLNDARTRAAAWIVSLFLGRALWEPRSLKDLRVGRMKRLQVNPKQPKPNVTFNRDIAPIIFSPALRAIARERQRHSRCSHTQM